jgi:Putative zinc-finger
MHEEYTDQLSDYLDGELDNRDTAALEAHLRECSACTAVLNDLKRVVARAQTLEPRPPQADLWAGIAARTERIAQDPSTMLGATLSLANGQRRFSLSITQLAAAAAVLMAVSSTLAVKLLAPDVLPPVTVTAPQAFTAAPPPAPDPNAYVSVTPVSFADAQYDAAVLDLEKALKAGRGQLDKSTIDIVEHNLQIIDQAIAQARDALAGDPANSYLSSHLVEARRRKLDLLRRAAALAETN